MAITQIVNSHSGKTRGSDYKPSIRGFKDKIRYAQARPALMHRAMSGRGS